MPDVAHQLNIALAGRYRIEGELGRGGMATVYLAEDVRHHRRVAIKVLHHDLAAALGPERFLREIETTARLHHPHILTLLESGAAGDLLYYVMPYVEGESLRRRLEREKQLPLGDALRIAREVADALDYAHRRGVVHRDIKPENILIEERHAVVADFGIARAIEAAGGAKLTETGAVIGTPAYMSPEQAVGSRELGGRSDLYSLACVLYEMLAGEPPFTGTTGESLVHQHLSVSPRPVRALRTAVPEGVDQALTKALAKPAADRFGTVAEFAAALEPAVAVAERGEARRGERPDAKRAAHRARWLAIGGVTVLVAIGTFAVARNPDSFSRWLGGSSAAHPIKKDWILVAEFDGPPDDSSLAVTTRDLLSAALDQSRVVATVPRDQILLGLEKAGKAANSRVDAELARELAYRNGVRAVLEGKIGRLGRGYSVVLRVVDADSASIILTDSAVAKDEDALIPALGRLAEKLRAGLGERRGAIAATRPMGLVATPSFEAYRLFRQGISLSNSLSSREAIPVLRDALALDPDFAVAWRALGMSYYNLGQLDSSLAAYDEALRRPTRLTLVQRVSIEGDRASADGDPSGALAAYRHSLQYDPTNPGALMNSALPLMSLGRFEEALENTRMAERVAVFGVPESMRENEVFLLSCLGRVDEAREVAQSIQGHPGARWRTYVELAAHNWARAESLAVSVLAEPRLDEDRRAQVLLYLASAQAARGALSTAAATLERVEEAARGAAAPLVYQDQARRGRLMLAILSRGVISLPIDVWARDSSTATLITRGLRAAIAGDRAGALRLLKVVQGRSRRELSRQGAAPALLAARIEALTGRWSEVPRMLQPIASQPVEIGTVENSHPAGMSAVRWFLADAFEQLGRPDSAVVTLERVTTDPAAVYQESYLRGIVWPFAHQRLVLVYARMGRIEEAERHLAILERDFTRPDPEVRHFLDEARAAVRAARGMSRPQAKPS